MEVTLSLAGDLKMQVLMSASLFLIAITSEWSASLKVTRVYSRLLVALFRTTSMYSLMIAAMTLQLPFLISIVLGHSIGQVLYSKSHVNDIVLNQCACLHKGIEGKKAMTSIDLDRDFLLGA